MENYEIREVKKHEDKPLKCLFKGLMFIGSALTFIRNFIANLVMLLIILLIIIAVNTASNFKDDVTQIAKGGQRETTLKAPVLYLGLDGFISEMPMSDNIFGNLQRQIQANLNKQSIHSLITIEKALDRAILDSDIKLVVINLSDTKGLTLSVANRIADKVRDLVNAGKKVYATASSYTQTSYVIAKDASTIYMDPLGEVALRGISLNSLYYKDLLDKAMITPYIFKAGKYKSAVEPFMQSSMSPEVKAEYANIALGLWDIYKDTLSSRKEIKDKNLIAPLDTMIANLSRYNGDTALMQKEAGLVDKLLAFYYLKDVIAKDYGYSKEHKTEPDMIDYETYASLAPKEQYGSGIAVIYGVGTITDIAQNDTDFAPENLVPIIDKVANDSWIRAAVFYVNSPGGSVSASEAVRRALDRLAYKKPLIISMNGMAASGGYWVSSAGHYIVATPETITGSIGVFGMSFGLHNLLNHFGVYQDGIATHELSQVAVAKSLDPRIQALEQQKIMGIYHKFIDLVSEARGTDKKDYQSFAEGRIFLAKEALDKKLIDEIGNLEVAIAKAEELGHLQSGSAEIIHMTPLLDPRLNEIEKLFFNASAKFLPQSLSLELAKLKNESIFKMLEQNKENSVVAISPIMAPKY